MFSVIILIVALLVVLFIALAVLDLSPFAAPAVVLLGSVGIALLIKFVL